MAQQFRRSKKENKMKMFNADSHDDTAAAVAKVDGRPRRTRDDSSSSSWLPLHFDTTASPINRLTPYSSSLESPFEIPRRLRCLQPPSPASSARSNFYRQSMEYGSGSKSSPSSGNRSAGFDFFDVNAQPPPLQISDQQRQSCLKALALLKDKAKDKSDVQFEFFSLKKLNKKALSERTLVANSPSNQSKNRYTDVLPFDDNRVNVSGYINASLVKSNFGEHGWQFIPTQGPLHGTFTEFWEMVYHYRSPMIVMLTPFDDTKCANYLPPSGSERVFKNITVQITASKVTSNNIVLRHLEVHRKEDAKGPVHVLHVQQKDWPDHGVPDSTIGVREILKRAYYLPHGSSPVVVHCSAGIGRTGVYLTLHDTIKRILLNDDSAVDIVKTVNAFRDQRAGMVQTMQQFLFIYTAVIDELKDLTGSGA